MSLLGLFNQTIQIYSTDGYGADGRQTFGAAVTLQARVQEVSKRVMLPDRSMQVLDAIVYVPPTSTVAVNDKLIYNGMTYKVFSRAKAIDGAGQVNHIKLELIKWQAT